MKTIRIRFPIKGIDFSDAEVTMEIPDDKSIDDIATSVIHLETIHSLIAGVFAQEISSGAKQYFVSKQGKGITAPDKTPVTAMEANKMTQLETAQKQSMVFYQTLMQKHPDIYQEIKTEVDATLISSPQ